MPETTFHIPIDDTNLFIRKIGSGEPVFVIHGGPGLNHNYLLPYLDKLSANHELIYFDQRYCGGSQPNMDFDKIIVSQFVEDIELLRKALGYDQITLIGHSFGAHLAFRYAIAYPKNVVKIISVCGLSVSWVGVGLFVKEFLKRTKSIREQLEEIRHSREFLEGDIPTHIAFYKLIFSSYCFNPCSTENLRLVFTKDSAKNGAFVSYRLREQLFTEQFDLRKELNKLDTPILVIHGSADPFPAEKARTTTSEFKNGYYIEFDECGHFPFMEKHEEFIDIATEFLVNSPQAFSELRASQLYRT